MTSLFGVCKLFIAKSTSTKSLKLIQNKFFTGKWFYLKAGFLYAAMKLRKLSQKRNGEILKKRLLQCVSGI
jgi:hypothetical protein